ncbi:MAG: hypothetical protein Q8P86_02930 [bacterium]|nr:hypothetical protein [bacterium]
MRNWKYGFALIDVLMCVAIFGLIVTTVVAVKNHRRVLQMDFISPHRGYPASSELLQVGTVYRVNASIVEERPSKTNFLAVLQEIKVMASDLYLHVGTNRLVELTKELSRGSYYRTGKNAGGKIVFTEVAPPVAK